MFRVHNRHCKLLSINSMFCCLSVCFIVIVVFCFFIVCFVVFCVVGGVWVCFIGFLSFLVSFFYGVGGGGEVCWLCFFGCVYVVGGVVVFRGFFVGFFGGDCFVVLCLFDSQ